MTEYQEMKQMFDKLGIGYTEITNEVNNDINPRHIALYVEEFAFVFDKKTEIFFDTRNFALE